MNTNTDANMRTNGVAQYLNMPVVNNNNDGAIQGAQGAAAVVQVQQPERPMDAAAQISYPVAPLNNRGGVGGVAAPANGDDDDDDDGGIGAILRGMTNPEDNAKPAVAKPAVGAKDAVPEDAEWSIDPKGIDEIKAESNRKTSDHIERTTRNIIAVIGNLAKLKGPGLLKSLEEKKDVALDSKAVKEFFEGVQMVIVEAFGEESPERDMFSNTYGRLLEGLSNVRSGNLEGFEEVLYNLVWWPKYIRKFFDEDFCPLLNLDTLNLIVMNSLMDAVEQQKNSNGEEVIPLNIYSCDLYKVVSDMISQEDAALKTSLKKIIGEIEKNKLLPAEARSKLIISIFHAAKGYDVVLPDVDKDGVRIRKETENAIIERGVTNLKNLKDDFERFLPEFYVILQDIITDIAIPEGLSDFRGLLKTYLFSPIERLGKIFNSKIEFLIKQLKSFFIDSKFSDVKAKILSKKELDVYEILDILQRFIDYILYLKDLGVLKQGDVLFGEDANLQRLLDDEWAKEAARRQNEGSL